MKDVEKMQELHKKAKEAVDELHKSHSDSVAERKEEISKLQEASKKTLADAVGALNTQHLADVENMKTLKSELMQSMGQATAALADQVKKVDALSTTFVNLDSTVSTLGKNFGEWQ